MVGYQDPQSGQKFILMKKQAIHIDGLDNHQLCPTKCHLNGMHIGEVPKFLSESPSETTHAIELTDPLDTAHLLIIPVQLSSETSYFDVYSSGIAENENEDIPKIRLMAKEPPWDPSMNEHSERETCMLDY